MEEDKKLREKCGQSEWQWEEVEKEILEWSRPGYRRQERAIPLQKKIVKRIRLINPPNMNPTALTTPDPVARSARRKVFCSKTNNT